MIFERCAFIFIYVFLSISLGSAKAASVVLDATPTRNQIALDRQIFDYSLSEAIALNRHNKLQLKSSQDSSLELAQKSNLETDLDAEPPTSQNLSGSEFMQTASDRYWALGAMALTSSISLFLLWILFKKPKSSDTVTEITATKIKSSAEVKLPVSNSDLATAESARTQTGTQTVSDSTVARLDMVQELIQDLQLENQTHQDKSEPISTDRLHPRLQITRRRKAIWELTKAGDYRSIEPLLKIMPEAPETDKSLIVEAVSQITHRSLKPINQQLFANLQHSDPEVRLNAVRDLKHLYQFVTPAIAKIALMQSDPDYQVRQTAIQTLKYFNADPLPTFDKPVAKNSVGEEINDLGSGDDGDGEANLHLVAYLLAELDGEK